MYEYFRSFYEVVTKRMAAEKEAARAVATGRVPKPKVDEVSA